MSGFVSQGVIRGWVVGYPLGSYPPEGFPLPRSHVQFVIIP